MREKGTPSNTLRTGRRPIFNEAERQRLEEFVTRDARTRRLGWDEICLEMEYACNDPTLVEINYATGSKRLTYSLSSSRRKSVLLSEINL